MKRWQWAVIVSLVVLGAVPLGLELWMRFQEQVWDVPPPMPLEQIPRVQGQLQFPQDRVVVLWGELVSQTTHPLFLVGLFRSPPGDDPLVMPDVQLGHLTAPGYFQLEVPRNVGPVYFYALPGTGRSPEGSPPDLSRMVAYPGNPILVRDRPIGGIRIEVP